MDTTGVPPTDELKKLKQTSGDDFCLIEEDEGEDGHAADRLHDTRTTTRGRLSESQ